MPSAPARTRLTILVAARAGPAKCCTPIAIGRTLPAGVVFDIHDDVTQAATISNADRMPFSDENSSGDPMRYTTAANYAAYVRGTIPAGTVFDIHDDLSSATIADADRMAFSDEGSAGDPMRYTSAANLANYMQGEVELSANRVTSDTFNTARIPNLSASKITSDTFNTARIPNLSASKITSDTFPTARYANESVTQAKIANAAVGLDQLKIGDGSMSGTADTVFSGNRYAMMPALVSAGQGTLTVGQNSTNRTPKWLVAEVFIATTWTVYWDYFTASDTPSVWAVTQDSDGTVVSLWESEDPASIGDTVAPLSVPLDENNDPLPGYTVVNVGLPALTVIEALYATLTATERTAALTCTGDYVMRRGWLSAFTGLSDLSTIEARFEPSGRQWAMRCAAQASDEAVTAFYLDNLVVDAGVWAVAP